MNGEERDVLIRLDTKVDYIKEGVDLLKASDQKQWERIDEHGIEIGCHGESISMLKRFFFILIGTLITTGVGIWISQTFAR